MKLLKAIFMAALVLAMASINETSSQEVTIQTSKQPPTSSANHEDDHLLPSKTLRRFQAADLSHHGGHHGGRHGCRRDYETCSGHLTCCNSGCYDLMNDKNHCGSCYNVCEFTEDCCQGTCVSKAFDERHCGLCHHACEHGQKCSFGICGYA
ncbi:hypothetical protein Nepgr_026198 [Nepenthes gracilis]|uniref:Uncharacterized protein n=1 Tax=Nepenthes gracilis TaxID=150966 RepID=A0AAD3T7H7_NEPGR|nr:hypothetical protein Nepgr_026198 [Nepenthes gracilis]